LIRQRLHQLDVRVVERAAGDPADREKAEERLADADRSHEHGTRLAALRRPRAVGSHQARIVGEVRRPERLSSSGDLVKHSPQAGSLGSRKILGEHVSEIML